MPYCPECHDEFQEWVKLCPDCNVALVSELADDPENEQEDEPLEHIATAQNEAIANMWSGILEEEGIRSLLKGQGLVASMYASPMSVPYEIYVLASEAEKAKEILKPFMED